MKRERQEQRVEEMADLIGTIATVRNGAAAIVLSEQLSKVVKAVVETNQKGKLQITLVVVPTGVNRRGEVNEMRVDIDSRMTLPSRAPGSGLFYPTASGTGLTRSDPDQAQMFESE